MGPPVVAAKLDIRTSIEDSALKFILVGGEGIHLRDPRTTELELDVESTDLETGMNFFRTFQVLRINIKIIPPY